MRRFLTAFICLSTLAMSQNVIAAAPTQSAVPGTNEHEAIEALAMQTRDFSVAEGQSASPALPERAVPAPGTLMLLVAGLSGLTAVGSRTGERSEPETK